LREIVRRETGRAAVSTIEIERFPNKVKLTLHSAKPGVLIGRKGESVKKLRQDLEAIVGKKMELDIKEIKNPDLIPTLWRGIFLTNWKEELVISGQ
jgi:small subunit ribosomal protein S3